MSPRPPACPVSWLYPGPRPGAWRSAQPLPARHLHTLLCRLAQGAAAPFSSLLVPAKLRRGCRAELSSQARWKGPGPALGKAVDGAPCFGDALLLCSAAPWVWTSVTRSPPSNLALQKRRISFLVCARSGCR